MILRLRFVFLGSETKESRRLLGSLSSRLGLARRHDTPASIIPGIRAPWGVETEQKPETGRGSLGSSEPFTVPCRGGPQTRRSPTRSSKGELSEQGRQILLLPSQELPHACIVRKSSARTISVACFVLLIQETISKTAILTASFYILPRTYDSNLVPRLPTISARVR